MSEIKRAIALGNLLVKQADVVAELQTQLKKAQAEYLKLEREDLPALMQELGLSSFQLETGETIKVVEDVTTKIPAKHKAAAHTWLLEHGFGGLLKTQVTVEFGRGERDAAETAAGQLQEHYEHVNMDESVHHSTLKAFVKEQREQGHHVPEDLFGIFPFNKATVSKR